MLHAAFVLPFSLVPRVYIEFLCLLYYSTVALCLSSKASKLPRTFISIHCDTSQLFHPFPLWLRRGRIRHDFVEEITHDHPQFGIMHG